MESKVSGWVPSRSTWFYLVPKIWGVFYEALYGCEVFTAPSSHRNGRLSIFGVKTGACEYGSIEVVERRCLGWDSGVVMGLMLRFESQVGWLRWEVVGDRARYSVNRQLIGRLQP